MMSAVMRAIHATLISLSILVCYGQHTPAQTAAADYELPTLSWKHSSERGMRKHAIPVVAGTYGFEFKVQFLSQYKKSGRQPLFTLGLASFDEQKFVMWNIYGNKDDPDELCGIFREVYGETHEPKIPVGEYFMKWGDTLEGLVTWDGKAVTITLGPHTETTEVVSPLDEIYFYVSSMEVEFTDARFIREDEK